MNNKEVVTKVAKKSGVNFDDCQKVIDAFEEVLTDELSNSKNVSRAFDKVQSVLNFFKR